MYRFVVSVLIFIPQVTSAAVTINEVAWMGTDASANDEWIELHNSGSAVSLDGWTLSDGMNLEIALSGTLAGNTYGVLERTDDDSAPGSAFMLYTGALTNSGATLTLRRGNGSIEDQVAGGENWQNIGGDNTTKETAQYTTSGWVTGPATPGRQNATAESTSPEDDEGDKEAGVENDSTSSSNDIHISLERPDNELTLSIDGPTRGYVNQEIRFYVEPAGLGERILDSLSYVWNFGNLETSSDAEATVRYPHPGEYVVVVEAQYGDYQARARHNITILPSTLSLERNQAGDLLVHNNASYEIDLSDYRLRGSREEVFPPFTLIAPRATLTIPQERVGGTGLLTALYDGAGEMVAMSVPATLTRATTLAIDTAAEPAPPAVASVVAPRVALAQVDPTPQISATSTSVAAASPAAEAAGLAAVANAAESSADTTAGIPNDKLPYLGLMGLIIIGILALYTRAPQTKKEQPFGLK